MSEITIAKQVPGKPDCFKIEPDEMFYIMPHRPPMMLVTQVDECNLAEKTLTATRMVNPDDPFVKAHFPDFQCMPPSFVVECLAQTAGSLMNLMFFSSGYPRKIWEVTREEFDTVPRPPYSVMAEAKVKQMDLAMAGERLSLYARVALQRKDMCSYQCEAKVGDRMIAKGEILLVFPPYMPAIEVGAKEPEATHVAG